MFEKHYSYVGGEDTGTLESVAIILNLINQYHYWFCGFHNGRILCDPIIVTKCLRQKPKEGQVNFLSVLLISGG